MGKKLEMTWPPGTQEAVKERMRAVVWAVDQHGGWRSPNVTADITKWLAADGYEIDQDRVAATLVRLDKEGYAIRVVQGKRTTEVELAPDLSVPLPAYVRARMARGAAAEGNGQRPGPRRQVVLHTSADPAAATAITAAPAGRRAPALPHKAPAVPPVFAELGQLAADWWRDDPDAALAWAADAVRNLRA